MKKTSIQHHSAGPPEAHPSKRALIIDDDRLARQRLSSLVEAHSDIRIGGEARCIEEAETLVAEMTPDLLFLDIQMPGGTGFELLARLTDPPPRHFCHRL